MQTVDRILVDMGFCYRCGQSLARGYPPGEDREREFCEHCGYIHYRNPKIQVAVVVTHNKRMLWIKRAIDPRAGFWELPGGFLEHGESLREAAAREVLEETGLGLTLESLELYLVGCVEAVNEVYILFRAEADTDRASPSEEAAEVAWFEAGNAPWEDLAFPQIETSLRTFFRDMDRGRFSVYYGEDHLGKWFLYDLPDRLHIE